MFSNNSKRLRRGLGAEHHALLPAEYDEAIVALSAPAD
jgi:hypothetical protein